MSEKRETAAMVWCVWELINAVVGIINGTRTPIQSRGVVASILNAGAASKVVADSLAFPGDIGVGVIGNGGKYHRAAAVWNGGQWASNQAKNHTEE
ncbi:hypothetical protein EV363DRAFT_1337356 [Boletus edulis]|uniref:Uncharacterized protein n=1 Tax=Boletus edulis BED1 TaxID=1328754 RepID=A0AAD4G6X8_BOLED|nr:hypothetical protein EV363DRAFT_1337356 [Boletus edulis]KAF8423934.1 hypothetical protein L210DRAFT_3569125 [Boletus edulis BED1]